MTKREYNQRYYEANRAALLAQKRQYYAANRSRITDQVRAYQATRREEKRIYNRQYREKNRARLSLYDRLRQRPPEYYERHRLYNREWREKNRAKIRRVNQVRYQRIKDNPVRWAERKAQERAYVQRNRRRVLDYQSKWRREHIHACRTKAKRRKARQKGAKGHYTLRQWWARIVYYGNLCAYCGTPIDIDTAQTEHIIPLVKGGTNWAANLAPACSRCNMKKGRQVWIPVCPQPKGELL